MQTTNTIEFGYRTEIWFNFAPGYEAKDHATVEDAARHTESVGKARGDVRRMLISQFIARDNR